MNDKKYDMIDDNKFSKMNLVTSLALFTGPNSTGSSSDKAPYALT